MSEGFLGSVSIVVKTIKTIFLICTLFILTTGQASYAACSAGIPCTDFDLINDPDAATDTDLNALKSDSGACDANFMNQIYSKAFLEASREVIMGQQLIHKPDSVLEYTCFDKRIPMTANFAGPIFSEKADDETEGDSGFQNRQVCLSTGDESANVDNDPPTCSNSVTYSKYYGQTTLDNVLEPLLLDTLEEYIEGNFAHTFMGEAITIDSEMETSSIPNDDSYAYECDYMSIVWNIARCVDFGEDDRFRSFADLVDADPRSIPAACSPDNIADDSIEEGEEDTQLDETSVGINPSDGTINPCPAAADLTADVETGISPNLIRLSNGCQNAAGIEEYVSFDNVKLYNDLIKAPGSYTTGNILDCGEPRPTGVPVVTYYYTDTDATFGNYTLNELVRTADIFYDHVCINPGCKYMPDFPGPDFEPGDPIPTSVPNPGTCEPL